jgi:2-polyprenyl-3-methyl-5-hydroxy-6-metoxy-1,4-benzoquinol methylase
MHTHFNQAAADWDSRPLSVQVASAVSAAIQNHVTLNANWDVLDYGCGTGLVSLALAQQVHSVVGIDSADEMLKVMREKAEAQTLTHVTTRHLDLSADPLPPERFDLIVSSMTLHHVADTTKLLQAFFKLLKPGAHIALADLDKEDGTFHKPDIPGVMHHGFERDALGDICARVGFTDIRFETAHVVRKQNHLGETRDYSLFLLLAQV